MAFQQSVAARNAQGDALTASVGNAGLLRIYDGLSMPANVAAAATGVKLSEHTCASPWAPAAASGVVSPTIPSNVNGLASGTAFYYRQYKSDGTTCVYQSLVVTSGAGVPGLVLNPSNNVITAGQAVQINTWTVTMGGA